MKIRIDSKILTILITLAIFLIIFFAGPANAIDLNLVIPEKEITIGSSVNMMPSIKIDTLEIVNIDYIELKLIKNNKEIICNFNAKGIALSECNDISINLLASSNSNYGYGYGVNYNQNEGYGYGYGFQKGLLNYNIFIKTDNLDLGKYKTELIVHVADKKFTINGEDILIKKQTKLNNQCSIRAFDGTFSVDDKQFSNNRIKFYITTRDPLSGKGSLSGQKGRDRFSYRFKINNLIISNDTNLIVNLSGNYRIGRNGIEKNIKEDAILNFDRINNKISLIGDKIKIKSMSISFIEGCDLI